MKIKEVLMGTLILMMISGCGGEKNHPEPKVNMPIYTVPPVPTPEVTPKPTESPTNTPSPTEGPLLIGEGQTKLLDKEADRLHNIKLAMKAVNGYVLAPGKIFSFNEIVGDRTTARGYRDATVLVNKEKQRGCGGGVCQLSTTIYHAAKSAGLTIMERNSHSGEVGYAEKGNDAAVNYGYLDMKFKNNTGKNIKIKTWMAENAVCAALYHLP